MNATAFGVAATALLVCTLVAQTVKQWRAKQTEGVSRWFFMGQVGASALFIVYSVMTGSLLFTITNSLILLSAFAGFVVLRLNKRRA